MNRTLQPGGIRTPKYIHITCSWDFLTYCTVNDELEMNDLAKSEKVRFGPRVYLLVVAKATTAD